MNRALTKVRAAFTLIELLLVIAVIGILASLFLPALARAKASSHSVQCKNNLRQLAIAMTLYVQEAHKYQGFYTYFELKDFGVGTYSACPGVARWLPYLNGNHRPFYCPAQKPLKIPTSYGSNGLAGDDPLSYGWNALGTSVVPPRKDLGLGPRWRGDQSISIDENSVLVPSDMIAISDNLGGTHDNFIIAPNDVYFCWKPGNRHAEGVNLAFCDGHIEYQKQAALIAPTEDARKRWNNDHQSHE